MSIGFQKAKMGEVIFGGFIAWQESHAVSNSWNSK